MITNLKQKLALINHGHYDTSTPEGRDLERTRNIALSAITAILAKGVAIITPFITIRFTLTYLGEETYGLWSTVASFFALFAFADLGLGSGLQTELSHASAVNDKDICRKLVSTTYVILVGVASLLILVILCAYPFIDWASIINAQTKEAIYLSGPVVLAIFIPKMINIPLALIQRTQNAMQEGYRTNLWQICGNLLGLVFVIVITIIDGGKVTMIVASSSIVVIVAAINMFVYFGKQRPELRPSIKLFDKTVGKRLLLTGVAFFILSIFTSLSLSIDNWIVAQISTLAEVTPYSVMLKLANMVNVVSLMLSTPLWAANGEALERGETDWVRRKALQIAKISAALAIVCSIGVLVLSYPALWLLTDNAVQPNYLLLAGMCLLNILISWTSPYFMVLNGARIIKFQIGNYVVYATISLLLKFWLGGLYGAKCIPWIGAITYLILLTIPTMWRADKATNTHIQAFQE